jgi:bifunctional DNA-binding transcriptional regulator/antitoxin component of YhaV-PrlF toxin-antitoxin module
MKSYRITTSGQVSLPAAVRRRWGTRFVQIEDRGDHVVVRPQPENLIDYLSGIWKGRTRLTSDEARAQLRAEEAANEARKLRIYTGS